MGMLVGVISLSSVVVISVLLVAVLASQGRQRERVLWIATAVLAVKGGLLFFLTGGVGAFLILLDFGAHLFGDHSSFHDGWVLIVLGLFIAGVVGIGGGFVASHSPRQGRWMMGISTAYYLGVTFAAVTTIKPAAVIERTPSVDAQTLILSCLPAICFMVAILASMWAEQLRFEHSFSCDSLRQRAETVEVA